MKRKTTDELSKLLPAAREIQAQFGTLPVRDCMRAWGYTSTSATLYTMNRMATLGLLQKIERGNKSIYRLGDVQ